MAKYLVVGIHENLHITSETHINDKGTLVLAVAEKKEGSMLDMFEQGEDIQGATGDLMLFPPNLLDWDKKPKSSTAIGQDFAELKNTLSGILTIYYPMDKIKELMGTQVMFRGLNINAQTQHTLAERFLNEEFNKAVYNNLTQAFINAMTPHYSGATFRLKLVRTSKAKHFAKFPTPEKNNVWIESMQIPKSHSQVKWTQKEIDNGMNSGKIVQATVPVDEEAQDVVDEMFNGGPGGPPPMQAPGAGIPVNTSGQPGAPVPQPAAAPQPAVAPQPAAQPVAQPAAQPAAPTPAAAPQPAVPGTPAEPLPGSPTPGHQVQPNVQSFEQAAQPQPEAPTPPAAPNQG